jgi:hypothetical protein
MIGTISVSNFLLKKLLEALLISVETYSELPSSFKADSFSYSSRTSLNYLNLSHALLYACSSYLFSNGLGFDSVEMYP